MVMLKFWQGLKDFLTGIDKSEFRTEVNLDESIEEAEKLVARLKELKQVQAKAGA